MLEDGRGDPFVIFKCMSKSPVMGSVISILSREGTPWYANSASVWSSATGIGAPWFLFSSERGVVGESSDGKYTAGTGEPLT